MDVLAVMDALLAGPKHRDAVIESGEATEARAAVAELIAADREFDEARYAMRDPQPMRAAGKAANRFKAAAKRRAAALARMDPQP